MPDSNADRSIFGKRGFAEAAAVAYKAIRHPQFVEVIRDDNGAHYAVGGIHHIAARLAAAEVLYAAASQGQPCRRFRGMRGLKPGVRASGNNLFHKSKRFRPPFRSITISGCYSAVAVRRPDFSFIS